MSHRQSSSSMGRPKTPPRSSSKSRSKSQERRTVHREIRPASSSQIPPAQVTGPGAPGSRCLRLGPVDPELTPQQVREYVSHVPRAAVDYAKVARRGTVDMTNARVPPELPNPQGITPSGWFESITPTSAPVARWMLYKESEELRLMEAWRPGIQPTRVECYRAHQQYYTVMTFRCIDQQDGTHDRDRVMPLRTDAPDRETIERARVMAALPLTIPENQMPYVPVLDGVLIGAGHFQEDASSAKYWTRAPTHSKGVQAGPGEILAIAPEVPKDPQEAAIAFEKVLYAAPPEWFRTGHDTERCEEIRRLSETGSYSERLLLALSIHIMHHYEAMQSAQSYLRVQHDPRPFKRQFKRMFSVITDFGVMGEDLKLARSNALCDLRKLSSRRAGREEQLDAARGIEVEFYYRNITQIHEMWTLMPVSGALLFGIPFSKKRGEATITSWRPITSAFIHRYGLMPRPVLLSIIARENPSDFVVAENEIGAVELDVHRRPKRQPLASDNCWQAYREKQERWAKIRTRTNAIRTGRDMPERAGVVIQRAPPPECLPGPSSAPSTSALAITDRPMTSTPAKRGPGSSAQSRASSAASSSSSSRERPPAKRVQVTAKMSTSKQGSRRSSVSSSVPAETTIVCPKMRTLQAEGESDIIELIEISSDEEEDQLPDAVPPALVLPTLQPMFGITSAPCADTGIEWRDDHVVVNRVYHPERCNECVEIAYDTPYNTLCALLRATRGAIMQRSVILTPRTLRGQVLLPNEMNLPGVRDYRLTERQMKINRLHYGISLPSRISTPLTFIIGNWEGQLCLPEDAMPVPVRVEDEEVAQKIRDDMDATCVRARKRSGDQKRRDASQKAQEQRIKREHLESLKRAAGSNNNAACDEDASPQCARIEGDIARISLGACCARNGVSGGQIASECAGQIALQCEGQIALSREHLRDGKIATFSESTGKVATFSESTGKIATKAVSPGKIASFNASVCERVSKGKLAASLTPVTGQTLDASSSSTSVCARNSVPSYGQFTFQHKESTQGLARLERYSPRWFAMSNAERAAWRVREAREMPARSRTYVQQVRRKYQPRGGPTISRQECSEVMSPHLPRDRSRSTSSRDPRLQHRAPGTPTSTFSEPMPRSPRAVFSARETKVPRSLSVATATEQPTNEPESQCVTHDVNNNEMPKRNNSEVIRSPVPMEVCDSYADTDLSAPSAPAATVQRASEKPMPSTPCTAATVSTTNMPSTPRTADESTNKEMPSVPHADDQPICETMPSALRAGERSAATMSSAPCTDEISNAEMPSAPCADQLPTAEKLPSAPSADTLLQPPASHRHLSAISSKRLGQDLTNRDWLPPVSPRHVSFKEEVNPELLEIEEVSLGECVPNTTQASPEPKDARVVALNDNLGSASSAFNTHEAVDSTMEIELPKAANVRAGRPDESTSTASVCRSEKTLPAGSIAARRAATRPDSVFLWPTLISNYMPRRALLDQAREWKRSQMKEFLAERRASAPISSSSNQCEAQALRASAESVSPADTRDKSADSATESELTLYTRRHSGADSGVSSAAEPSRRQ